jgi:hypothetical protein
VPPIPTQEELDAYFRELGLLIVTGRYPGGG